jgi:hypothetical protein
MAENSQPDRQLNAMQMKLRRTSPKANKGYVNANGGGLGMHVSLKSPS